MAHRKILLTATVAAALAVPALAVPATAAAPRPGRFALRGSTPAWATAANARGDAPSAGQLDVTVNLALRDPAGAEATATAVSDPKSAAYGKYLTPAQFKAQYAATDATVASVRSWLTSSHLSVLSSSPTNRSLRVRGTVGAIEQAFGTQLKTYSHNGATLRAPAVAATVPSDLAGTILSVGGLTQTFAKPSSAGPGDAPPPAAFVSSPVCSSYYGQKYAKDSPVTAGKTPTAYGKDQPLSICGYTAQQVRSLYGMDGLVKAGLNGRGQTVAIVDAYAAPTVVGDTNTWARNQGEPTLKAGQVKQYYPDAYTYGYDDKVNGDQCGENGWYGEETLDFQAAHGMAPAANITYVAGASCQDSDLNDAVQKIVDNHLANIVSNSYGDLGESVPAGDIAATHATFVQAATEGIGIFFSSGDDGDEVILDGGRAVDFPASDPYVTAVGGTSAGIDKYGRRIFELGWETSSSKDDTTVAGGAWTPALPGTFSSGGGGGVSTLYTQPAYQKGVVPSAISMYLGGVNGKPGRALPDVAAIGDPTTGYLVGETQTFSDGTVKFGQYRIGGTSLSSPLFAGMEALADQAFGRAHGFANPALYALNSTPAFFDPSSSSRTTSSVRVNYTNSENPSAGYTILLRSYNQQQTINLRPGYDDVTGVGTPNGLAFVLALGHFQR